jgi:hypothetical protein
VRLRLRVRNWTPKLEVLGQPCIHCTSIQDDTRLQNEKSNSVPQQGVIARERKNDVKQTIRTESSFNFVHIETHDQVKHLNQRIERNFFPREPTLEDSVQAFNWIRCQARDFVKKIVWSACPSTWKRKSN